MWCLVRICVIGSPSLLFGDLGLRARRSVGHGHVVKG